MIIMKNKLFKTIYINSQGDQIILHKYNNINNRLTKEEIQQKIKAIEDDIL